MFDIPNEDNKTNKYICAARCPDLDRLCMQHCVSTDPHQEKCPCDKHPVWIPLEECDK